MNNEALSKIESRWLAASGGPWTVVDMRAGGPGLTFASNTAIEAFRKKAITEDGRVRVDHVRFTNFNDAKEAGACKTIEEWAGMLEKQLFKGDFDDLAERFKVVVTKSPHEYAAICESIDKSFIRGKDPKHEEPSYSFAISPTAKPEDVELLRRAPEDIGNLVEEVRKSWAKADELRSALEQAREEAKEAKKRADLATKAVDQFREAAARIASL